MRKFFWLLAFTFLFQLLNAQIVNIEDKRVFRTDTVGWFGQLDFGLNLVKNKTTVTTIKGSGRLDFLHHKHSAFSLTDYSFVRAGQEQFVNQGFQHLRYNYALSEHSVVEAFIQAQYNERIRIKLRTLSGTGWRYQLARKEREKAFLGIAYMYEYEAIADTTIIHRNHRLSSYLSFNWQVSPFFTISNTSYYQPVITDFDNYRINTATHIQLNLTERLLLKSSFSLTYDSKLSEEVVGIPATIFNFINGLSWRF